MFTERRLYRPDDFPAATCKVCKSNRFRFQRGTLTCTNCGEVIKKTRNKYGARRTEYNGRSYDSKLEANVASQLDLRLKAGEITDVIPQFKLEMWCYRENGERAFMVGHKVDFRITHIDGTFELIEAKGVETTDYKWRRKFLEKIWLPDNKDYTYTVIKK